MKSKSNFVYDTCWGNFPFEMKITVDQIKNIIKDNIEREFLYRLDKQIDLPVWFSVWHSVYLIGILRSFRKRI